MKKLPAFSNLSTKNLSVKEKFNAVNSAELLNITKFVKNKMILLRAISRIIRPWKSSLLFIDYSNDEDLYTTQEVIHRIFAEEKKISINFIKEIDNDFTDSLNKKINLKDEKNKIIYFNFFEKILNNANDNKKFLNSINRARDSFLKKPVSFIFFIKNNGKVDQRVRQEHLSDFKEFATSIDLDS